MLYSFKPWKACIVILGVIYHISFRVTLPLFLGGLRVQWLPTETAATMHDIHTRGLLTQGPQQLAIQGSPGPQKLWWLILVYCHFHVPLGSAKAPGRPSRAFWVITFLLHSALPIPESCTFSNSTWEWTQHSPWTQIPPIIPTSPKGQTPNFWAPQHISGLPLPAQSQSPVHRCEGSSRKALL